MASSDAQNETAMVAPLCRSVRTVIAGPIELRNLGMSLLRATSVTRAASTAEW
jgi:hypothetical protein